MKRDLYFLNKQLDESMILTDGMSYSDGEPSESEFFSDEQENAQRSKMNALTSSISKEINSLPKRDILNKLDTGEYWLSKDGLIKFSDMGSDHLARLPRYLFNSGKITNKSEIPIGLVNEINKRGFKILDSCVVIQG